MLDVAGNRTVTILRPNGLSVIDLYEDALADNGVAVHQHTDDPVLASLERDKRENLDESLDVIRELIEETADRLKLHLAMYEYDLPPGNVPSYTARKWIGKTNLITTIEPNHSQLAYVSACLRDNPVMSVFLAYNDPNFLFEENRVDVIDSRSVPILQKSLKPEKQQRIFASCTKWNAEKITPIITKALSYPLTPPASRPT